GATDQRGRAFGGQRHAPAEVACADLFAAGELCALLSPGRARTREDPRRAEGFVVGIAADQRGGAFSIFGGERHADAEFALAELFAAGELCALLGPGRARAREHPRRADDVVVAGAADQLCVAFGGERHALAEFAFADLFGAFRGELCALLGPGRA